MCEKSVTKFCMSNLFGPVLGEVPACNAKVVIPLIKFAFNHFLKETHLKINAHILYILQRSRNTTFNTHEHALCRTDHKVELSEIKITALQYLYKQDLI